MTNRLRALISGLAIAAASVVAAPQAEAASILLTDGVTSLLINDNAGSGLNADQNSLLGFVSFTGTIGNWTFTLAAGQTKPHIGSATDPAMELQVLASSTTGGTLTVLFGDTGYGPSNTSFTAGALGATATGGLVTYQVYQDSTNLLFGSSTLPVSQTFTPGLFGPYTATGNLSTGANPYSLTQVVQISHSNGASTSSATVSFNVPDGGTTAVMLGSALLGFGLLRRRFRLG